MTTVATPASELRETYEAAKANARKWAERDFARHVIEEHGPQEWTCHTPGTGNMLFRVIVRRGTVIVWGDIGEATFRGGEAGDTLAWLRRAVYSPEYLLEKLSNRKAFEDFYPDDVLDRLAERAAEGDRLASRQLGEARDRHEWHELNRHTWARICDEEGCRDSEDYSLGTNYGGHSLIIIEALRWFVEHLLVSHVENGGEPR